MKKLSKILFSILFSFLLLVLLSADRITVDAANTVATGVNPFTGITYTHNAMHDGKNIFLGIDVSYYQGTIDWSKVKAAGVQFVILRLGYRGSSTGTLTLDKNFQTYAKGATDAGLPIGVYFYTEALNENEAALEAAYCVEQMKNYKITLPVAYDYENAIANGRREKAGLSKAKATNLCKAFCATIQGAGYTPMVYANKTDLTNAIDGAALAESYKIWLAQYNKQATYTGNYEFWQYSSSGTIDGISGKVDCNFWYTNNTKPDADNGIKITKAKFKSIASQVYSAKAKTPAPVITYDGKTLKKGTDYLLTYANNINIGKATVTVTGINDYSGTKTLTFKILPKPVAGLKKKSTKLAKKVEFTWSKRSYYTGYRIYKKSTQNGTTYSAVTTIKNKATTSYVSGTLKANRTYFYAVRAYTLVNGTKYFSDYTYLTIATNPTVKTQQVKKAVSLYKESDVESGTNKVLLKLTKGETITHLGELYLTGSKFVYHVKVVRDGVTYKGYLPSTTEFV